MESINTYTTDSIEGVVNASSTVAPDCSPCPPFSKHTYFLIDVIVGGGMTGTIAVSGLVTNLINIIVFYQQGIFVESSTPSLTGLAVSDFFCCLFVLWGSICIFISHFLETPEYKWSVSYFYWMTAVRPKTIFNQITCWLTAFIAVERFLSVTIPFKVKQIVTPKRNSIGVCIIFLVTILIYYPQYMTFYPVWKQTSYNTSKLMYAPTGFVDDDTRQIFIILNPIAFRIVTILIVVVCNITVLCKVKSNATFRKTKTTRKRETQTLATLPTEPVSNRGVDIENGSRQSEIEGRSKNSNKNQREMRLVRMITTICVVFVICFIPDSFFVAFFYVGTKIDDGKSRYHPYVSSTAHVFGHLLETLSSSTNIIIYYTLSSRYRQCLTGCCKRNNASLASNSYYTKSKSATATTGDNVSHF